MYILYLIFLYSILKRNFRIDLSPIGNGSGWLHYTSDKSKGHLQAYLATTFCMLSISPFIYSQVTQPQLPLLARSNSLRCSTLILACVLACSRQSRFSVFVVICCCLNEYSLHIAKEFFCSNIVNRNKFYVGNSFQLDFLVGTGCNHLKT